MRCSTVAWHRKRSLWCCAHAARRQICVAEVFSSAKLPYALQRSRSFADTATGRALVGLLRCSSDTGELADLLSWLRAPGLLKWHPELADALEVRARRTGAFSAAQARQLWGRTHWRIEALDRLGEAAERGAGALIERTGSELQWLFCAPRRGGASVLERDELDEARALAAGRRALSELADLARASSELAPGDAGELARVLEEVELISGDRPGRGMVAVLDPLALRARRVRALFVCRLQEDLFPASARPRPLLDEAQRRRLAQASGLRLGEHEDALAAERYLFYAAVSRPQELLVLSWHTADEDGAPRSRSLFVDDVCDLFDERLVQQRAQRALGSVEPVRACRPATTACRPATTACRPAARRGGERAWSAVRRAAADRATGAHLVGLLAGAVDQMSGALVRGEAAAR